MPKISIKQAIINRPQSVLETEESNTDTEYCRASESRRMLDKAVQRITSLRNDLIEEKRKNIALDKIVREVVDDKKSFKIELEMTKQELDNIKNKGSVRLTTSLNEHALNNFLKDSDDKIKEESLVGIDDLVEKYREIYK